MAVPAALLEVAEDDEVTAVDGDDLPVAAAQRAVRPPAVFDEPGLADAHDLMAVDGQRAAAGTGEDPRRCGDSQPPRARAHGSGSNGVRTMRRSGTRESGSTAS